MVIIEAALKAILPRPFMLTLLQPEATNPGIKGGWPVVLKWCRQSRTNGYASLEEDPTMYQFDFLFSKSMQMLLTGLTLMQVLKLNRKHFQPAGVYYRVSILVRHQMEP